MSPWSDVPVLEGSLVRLEPLSGRHAADLAAVAEEDRSDYRLTLVPAPGAARDGLGARLERHGAAYGT